jgi:hypothetical protein
MYRVFLTERGWAVRRPDGRQVRFRSRAEAVAYARGHAHARKGKR